MFYIMSFNSFMIMTTYLSLLCYGISMKTFVMLWVLMEITSFLNFMLMYNLEKNFSSVLNFLIIQSLASLATLALWYTNLMGMLLLSLFFKMAIGPFFFWFMDICHTVSNLSFLILSIFQKMLPMLILLEVPNNTSLILFTILVNAFIVSIISCSFESLRSILILSSLMSNSWMLLGLFNLKWMFIYLLLYSISLMFMLQSKNNNLLLMNLLAIMGLPPFPLFPIKLMLLLTGYDYSYLIISLPLLSLGLLYSQIRFATTSLIFRTTL